MINIVQLRKKAKELEKSIRKNSRMLLETEIMIAKWEILHCHGKVYESVDDFINVVSRKLRTKKV